MNIFKKNSGTILIITIWILTLLTAVTLSITYRMKIQLKLIDNEISREEVFFIAKAGIVQAISVLNQDTNTVDTLTEKWSNYSVELYRANLFKNIKVGKGQFTVSYIYNKDIFTGTQQVLYGMKDEERKININKATQSVLESLPGMTSQIATSIRAWRGDTDLGQDVMLSEDVYYQGLNPSYARKGKPFDCLEELTLVRDITEEILFGKDLDGDGGIDVNESGLAQNLTVFGDGLVNINTANITVLRALGFSEDLSYRIYNYRLGYDGLYGTSDDSYFSDVGSIANNLSTFEPLTPEETSTIQKKASLLKVMSRFFEAASLGSISGQAECLVKAVMDKESPEGKQVVRWTE